MGEPSGAMAALLARLEAQTLEIAAMKRQLVLMDEQMEHWPPRLVTSEARPMPYPIDYKRVEVELNDAELWAQTSRSVYERAGARLAPQLVEHIVLRAEPGFVDPLKTKLIAKCYFVVPRG